MRRIVLSLAFLGALSGAGAAPAAADPPSVRPLPDAACNQGTANAHQSAPPHSMGHAHIPHSMGGECMTMPAGSAGH